MPIRSEQVSCPMAFPDGTADFRSDTVTRPTDEMRAAMASAPVGDDVYGEDPTVNALQEAAAGLLGKEAALFLPSGTMGNQIALNILTRPGEGLVCVENAHIRRYEAAGAAALSGLQILPVPTSNGEITVEALQSQIGPWPGDHHAPRPALLTWENTHNVSGGTVVPIALMEQTTKVARERGLAVHLDGARIFNAAVASGIDVARYAGCADTVQFCVSKGLGAPVGSLIAGSVDLIEEAHRRRKRFGGGMRQAGIIAAAGLLALDHRHALAVDHEMANELATGINARFPGASSDPQTNMVIVHEEALGVPAGNFQDRLASAGVFVGDIVPGVLRFVTHRDVDLNDVKRVLAALDALAEEGA